MAVMQMQRISICALKQHRKAILEKLQTMGVVEITPVLEDDIYFRRMDTTDERILFEKTASLADRALDILENYTPEKKSMWSSLAGKVLIEANVQADIIRRKDELLEIVRQIQALDKERAECKAEILKLENTIQGLAPWMLLDVPMKAQRTDYTSMILGTFPGAVSIESVYESVAASVPDVEGYEVDIISSGQDQTCVALFSFNTSAEAVEDAMRSRGFSRISQEWPETPAQVCRKLEVRIKGYTERIGDIKTQMCDLAKHREEIKLLADYYRTRADRYEVLGEIFNQRPHLLSAVIFRKNMCQNSGELLRIYMTVRSMLKSPGKMKMCRYFWRTILLLHQRRGFLNPLVFPEKVKSIRRRS